MRPYATYLCVGCLWSAAISSGHAQGEFDDPKGVIQRAIKASGGKERLAQLLKYRVKTKGRIIDDEGRKADLVAESWLELPLRAKFIIQVDDGINHLTIVRVLNRESAWQQLNGDTRALDDDLVTGFQHGQYETYLTLLYPLVEEKDFTLKKTGESNWGERDAIGVKVSSKSKHDVSLYFDKRTGLLAKTVAPSLDPRYKGVGNEVFFDDYKEIHGLKYAHKVTMQIGGKKHTETELIELEPLQQIDRKMFARPDK